MVYEDFIQNWNKYVSKEYQVGKLGISHKHKLGQVTAFIY